MERRKYERTAIREAVVVVNEAGEGLLGESADLSVAGMFIDDVQLPFGARVVVHVRFGGRDPFVSLAGVVRWARSGGIGVQFGALGALETHAITEAIARAAPSRTRERVTQPAMKAVQRGK